MTLWRWTLWTVTVFAGVMAILLTFDVFAAPQPERPPERRPLVSIADLTCKPWNGVRQIMLGRGGDLVVSYPDENGCTRWQPWTPIVGPR
ncbi:MULTISPECIES: hypothetical protein [unclassified Aurantimonas]|uniref:hypothetical protein n=1 Tax=unclassified Aurantimonas TaxID=2638230 RepID=UPI002E17A199|nr:MULTISPECIES: hypothetical protein [unclassified Aurantimonas]MEC5289359.1 hypothetical protein [Aurantimonas sp. C2-3-R2]MEC5410439.1 hypothetical protein [Aurantimonas sp. C2-4-R8]